MYQTRLEAATALAKEIFTRHGSEIDLASTIVLSLPNGGVPIGALIAKELTIPHNIIITRKIGHPSNQNYAIGAISELDEEGIMADTTDLSLLKVAQAIQDAKDSIQQARKVLRPSHLLAPKVKNKTVILVDEGILSGQSISAAIVAIKKQEAANLILAVPLASRDASELIRPAVDSYICLKKPALFMKLSNFYEEFPDISNDEVRRTLLGQGN